MLGTILIATSGEPTAIGIATTIGTGKIGKNGKVVRNCSSGFVERWLLSMRSDRDAIPILSSNDKIVPSKSLSAGKEKAQNGYRHHCIDFGYRFAGIISASVAPFRRSYPRAMHPGCPRKGWRARSNPQRTTGGDS